jgi:hypothetical protein
MFSIESLVWSFPLVFMLHDLEEIIMVRPWLDREAERLRQRFPGFADRFLHQFRNLTTSGFALAVTEEFVLFVLLCLACLYWQAYTLWAAVLVAFFIHFLMHIGQFLLYRRYIPGLITTLLGSIYSLWALALCYDLGWLEWPKIAILSALSLLAMLLNLFFAHFLAGRFDAWLRSR